MKQAYFALTLLCVTTAALPIITNENEPSNFPSPESRKHKHKIRRPCSRSLPEGRKFFDWSIEFVDVNVNYNHNYNYNCGGGTVPAASSSSSHVQGAGVGSHLINHLGSHQGGGGNGPLGLGLLPLLFGPGGTSSSSSSSSSSSASSGSIGVASPPVRPAPVTEVPQDDVLPDRIAQLKPGTFVTASNPFFGSYSYNLSSNRLANQIDKGIDWLLSPLWNLL